VSQIGISDISVNTTAVQGPAVSYLFSYAGQEGLTLGQLTIAVCCKRGAVCEEMAVTWMNRINATNKKLQAYSSVTAQIMRDGTVYDEIADIEDSGYEPQKVPSFCTLEVFLSQECGIDTSVDIKTVTGKLTLGDKMKHLLDELSRESEEQIIKLQTQISRRDVAFTTATQTTKGLMKSAQSIAGHV